MQIAHTPGADSRMHLIEVKSEKEKRDFLDVPLKIYSGDPCWIRPLNRDIEAVFDTKKNKFFRHGEAIRWLLADEEGTYIGRVSAFINRKTSEKFEQPTGGMGFFECVNDQKSAYMLFDGCKTWLAARGMEAMDGPVNFGEKDRWLGLLTDGFSEPAYCMCYNPPYYKVLFESYGFKTYYEQFFYMRGVDWLIPEKYREKSDRIAKDPNYRAEHLQKKRLEKYTHDFMNIYNKAWGKHAGFKPISIEQADLLMKAIKPIMDENIIWFVYYKEEPIAFNIMLPEINQIFKRINNGRLGWFEKLLFIWYRWRGVCRRMNTVVFGVIPEFQGKGVEGYLIMAGAKHVQPMKKYDDFEMTWVGDFNPKVIHLVESIGAKQIRTAVTYRKLFDDTKPFKRCPVIE